MIASIMKVGSSSAVIGMSLFIAAPCLLHLRRISGLQRSSFTTSAGSTKTNEFQYTKDNVQVLVDKMEELVQVDEGRRGIKEIILPAGELYNAAMDLANAHTVVIITGFPCLLNNTPPTETDGPLGALAIAKCLLLLGKDVIVATDECNEEVVLACAAASANKNKLPGGTKVGTLTLESFPGGNAFDAKEEARMLSLSHRADMVVAIERMGPCADGRYLTMRGFDMTALAAPLEELLKPSVAVFAANDGEDAVHLVNGRKPRSIGIGNNSSIFPLLVFVPFYVVLNMWCIRLNIVYCLNFTSGDGGNEVGMGKVYDAVLNSKIANARAIACVVPANHLLVCSVSNWGGYALAAATGVVGLVNNINCGTVRKGMFFLFANVLYSLTDGCMRFVDYKSFQQQYLHCIT
jgi:D-glutamate cyclase